MFDIEIHIPRPKATLAWVLAGVFLMIWLAPGSAVPAEGGSGIIRAADVSAAEGEARELRVQQEVLGRREEILRYQLQILLREAARTEDAAILSDIDAAREHFIALSKDRRKAEEALLETLREVWEAQGFARSASRGSRGAPPVFEWPIEPLLGLSAHFDDEGYRKRFGMEHHAIDIPANQESIVYAAADGVVISVSENGMGFNSLTIEHSGGFATLYGHVTEFLVEEGQAVRAGQKIALSGGMPGTKGAGVLTTGPHLHFEVISNGREVDPLLYLPPHEALGG